MRYAIIEDEVFVLAPNFCRAVDIVEYIDNAIFSADLADRLQAIAAKYSNTVQCIAQPSLDAWDQVHRLFGSNPNRFPPSLKSLLKRAGSGRPLPFVNSAVAIMNTISLSNLIPCGGDDLGKVVGNLVLGVAKGTETFVPLGDGVAEHPDVGEVIYYDSATGNVLCRRWNWRNGDVSKITSDTSSMLINIDCLPPTHPEHLPEIQEELGGLLAQYCGASVQFGLLHRDHRSFSLSA